MSTHEIEQVTNTSEAVERRQWRKPKHSLRENTDDFALSLDVPGVNREGVNISFDDGLLTIEAVKMRQATEEWTVLSREIPEGDFRLSVRLNKLIDVDKITAEVAAGVLTLSLPKAETAKPRKIAVN